MTLKGMEYKRITWPQAVNFLRKKSQANYKMGILPVFSCCRRSGWPTSTVFKQPGARSFNRGAFTVIELTVTLTILAVMLLAVHGVLARTLSSSQKADQANRRATISDAILRRMAADLRSAFMASTHEECFKGDSESLHFVTSVTSMAKVGQEESAFNSVGYVLGKNEKSSAVFRLFRREARGKVDLDEGEYRELYPYVGSIKFEYLQKMTGENDQDAIQVKEDWDSLRDRGLPLAVQMELTLFFPESQAAVSSGTFTKMEGSRYTAIFKIPAGGYFIPDPDIRDADQDAKETE